VAVTLFKLLSGSHTPGSCCNSQVGQAHLYDHVPGLIFVSALECRDTVLEA